MKKFLIMLAIAGVSLTSMAQETETTTEKYSVATNSFWSNWFVQGGVQWTAFYSSLEHGFDTSNNPLKSFRSNPQASVAIGKWFTPGLGLRTKVSGIWGKANGDSFKYWNAQEQVLFNLSNMFCGYNPKRVYNCIPFAGAGFARNMSSDMYAMGMSIGLLNEFNINKRVAINLELGWNRLENDFYSEGHANNGPRGWDSHDNYLYAELGLTLNIGKTGWAKVPDVDAIKALSQSQIDALNAQLADSKSENERLKAMLNEKPKEVAMPESINSSSLLRYLYSSTSARQTLPILRTSSTLRLLLSTPRLTTLRSWLQVSPTAQQVLLRSTRSSLLSVLKSLRASLSRWVYLLTTSQLRLTVV